MWAIILIVVVILIGLGLPAFAARREYTLISSDPSGYMDL